GELDRVPQAVPDGLVGEQLRVVREAHELTEATGETGVEEADTQPQEHRDDEERDVEDEERQDEPQAGRYPSPYRPRHWYCGRLLLSYHFLGGHAAPPRRVRRAPVIARVRELTRDDIRRARESSAACASPLRTGPSLRQA